MVVQYSELRPTSGWDLLASLRHPCKFQCVSRLSSVTARQSSSGHQPNFAAPPIFGRAAITLGICPHSSLCFVYVLYIYHLGLDKVVEFAVPWSSISALAELLLLFLSRKLFTLTQTYILTHMHRLILKAPDYRYFLQRTVVQKDCQARNLNREDAVDHSGWKKLIKIGWWSGWWVGECFFWYWLTRVVPDNGPWNNCCCCCCLQRTAL